MNLRHFNLRFWLRKSQKAKFIVRVIPCFYRLQTAGINLANHKELGKISKILKLFPGKMSEEELLSYLLYSQSEIDQELIAFLITGSNGYFVEFGACNGVVGSNTYFLEKTQGWTGVLSEPIPHWFKDIKNHRTAKAYPYAVSDQHWGKVEFIETNQPGLSTLKGYENLDRHQSLRADGMRYEVETTTLSNLLNLACSPKQIDYLSMDTEGSELDILLNFPFEEYNFRFISIEHNHSKNQKKIKELMNLNGYREILTEFSRGDWWFVPES
jgi:FkbM family methyltransferase